MPAAGSSWTFDRTDMARPTALMLQLLAAVEEGAATLTTGERTIGEGSSNTLSLSKQTVTITLVDVLEHPNG